MVTARTKSGVSDFSKEVEYTQVWERKIAPATRKLNGLDRNEVLEKAKETVLLNRTCGNLKSPKSFSNFHQNETPTQDFNPKFPKTPISTLTNQTYINKHAPIEPFLTTEGNRDQDLVLSDTGSVGAPRQDEPDVHTWREPNGV